MASPAVDPDVQAFRMPAEWEPHEATWLGWPHSRADWPGRFAPIPWAYYRALEENRERRQGARLADGSRPEVLDQPMPSPLVFDGRRMPASYANSYVANAAVLVPTFNGGPP